MNKKRGKFIFILIISLIFLLGFIYYSFKIDLYNLENNEVLTNFNEKNIYLNPILDKEVEDSSLQLYLSFNQDTLPGGVSNYGATQIDNGKSGKAYDFKGWNYMQINSEYQGNKGLRLNDTNKFTISTWVFVKAYNSTDQIGNYGINYILWKGDDGYSLLLQSGKPTLKARFKSLGVLNVTSKYLVPLNRWVHLAGTWNSSDLKLYQDCKLASSITFSDIMSPYSSPEIRIGKDVLPRFFNGSIDEIKIYNRTLNETEIKNECNYLVLNATFNENIQEGIIENGEVDKVQGVSNKAYEFDGTNYLSMTYYPALNLTDYFTLSAFVKTYRYNPTKLQYIISKGASCVSPNRMWDLLLNRENRLILWFSSNNTNVLSPSSNSFLLPDVFYHVAVVYNKGEVSFYINGSLDNKNISFKNNLTSYNDQKLMIGGGYCPSSNANFDFFNGVIDEVKIYSKALTPEEIMNEYKSYIGVSQSQDYCIDSEDNVEFYPYFKGIVNYSINGENFSKTDRCVNSSDLIEYYCDFNEIGDPQISNRTYICENNTCNDGICISDFNIACEDSDDGPKFDTAGSVNLSFLNSSSLYYDSCQDDKTLIEMVCENNSKSSIEYFCPEEQICSDGACINSNNPPPECIDGQKTCYGTYISLCIEGKIIPPQQIFGECGFGQNTSLNNTNNTINPQIYASLKMIVLIIIILIIFVASWIIIYFFIIKNKKETNKAKFVILKKKQNQRIE